MYYTTTASRAILGRDYVTLGQDSVKFSLKIWIFQLFAVANIQDLEFGAFLRQPKHGLLCHISAAHAAKLSKAGAKQSHGLDVDV
jgi:hypothetical protein